MRILFQYEFDGMSHMLQSDYRALYLENEMSPERVRERQRVREGNRERGRGRGRERGQRDR